MNSLIFSILLLTFTVWAEDEPSHPPRLRPATPQEPRFVVYLDAGYRETTVKVVRRQGVPADDNSNEALILKKKITPGLKAFVGELEKLKEHLRHAVEEAARVVPQNRREQTPLLLAATSGLRRIPAEDINTLLQDSREALKDSSVNRYFKFRETWAWALNGEAEAVFTWLAANFNDNPNTEIRESDELVGVLDLQEYALQIAFIPADGMVLAESYPIEYDENQQEPYVQNFLTLGSESIKTILASSLRNRTGPHSRPPYDNPCMLKGDIATVEISPGDTVQLRGEGDPEKCQAILKEILKPATGVDCLPKPCSVGRIYQPSVEGVQFYATEGFVHSINALNIRDPSQGQLNIEQLQQAAFSYCRKNLAEITGAGRIPTSQASQVCLEGIFIPTLLKDSFKFNPATSNISVNETIKGSVNDWTVGLTLHMEFHKH